MLYKEKPSIQALYGTDDSEHLIHYGRPQPYNFSPIGSGRYRKGSGENPNERGGGNDFYSQYKSMHAQGMSDNDIAKSMGITVSLLRKQRSIYSQAERKEKILYAQKLKDHGYSTAYIADKMDLNESSVRSLLKQAENQRYTLADKTYDTLKDACNSKQFIDVGVNVNLELGVSEDQMKTALLRLTNEGYKVYTFDVPQPTNPNQKTTMKVLAPEGSDVKYIKAHLDEIQSINEYSPDAGETFFKVERPKSIDSSRVMVRYAEEGGVEMDGVILLRKGVEDTSLGNSHYAQVRIAVDDSHYLKGMAMYGDDSDFPPGVDIIFNTNKHVGTPMLGPKDNTVLKPLKNDPDNPFGAYLKAEGQRHYQDENGEWQLSVVNKLREEGAWDDYSKSLSSQFLSKQPQQLIDMQLKKSIAQKQEEYDEIASLTNPTVKKALLKSFAEDCDSAAVDLKAAALPRQSSKVILPIPSLKDNEIYAPTYEDGEHVVLIRYPHGGTFEIPELVVNNRQPDGKRLLNQAKDAVGINAKVAERLSGADFDGDTVVVIPLSSNVRIKTSPPLDGLKDFDPKAKYPGHEGMTKMSSREKGIEMGKVSNLITDMTLIGQATKDPNFESDLARAVRHSMVVIDAEKHGLDWKKSEADNGIDALKAKYQLQDNGHAGGATTLISRASSEQRVAERKDTFKVNAQTGEKEYTETGRTIKQVKQQYVLDSQGKRVYETDSNGKRHALKEDVVNPTTGKKVYEDTGKLVTQKSTRMAEAKDAYELVSRYNTPQEQAYANYANSLKALANKSRKEEISTPNLEYSPSAHKAYENEVNSLEIKLNNALKNSPKERMATLKANAVIQQKIEADPTLKEKENKEQLQKVRNMAMNNARAEVGANKSKVQIEITEKEWEAIQAGAISHTKLEKILNNANMDDIRKLATPRDSKGLSNVEISTIENMIAMGYTQAEVAQRLGISASTVNKYM